jgi:pyridoxamine 5'-phosphate oxidase
MPTYEELLSIGAAARTCGVATSTLRYYEERALVVPARRRPGHRWYTRQDLRRVMVVQMAQSFGMSLQSIATFLNESGDAWRDVLSEHLAELDARVACARAAKEFLTHARECPASHPLRDCGVMIAALDSWIENGLPGPASAATRLGSDAVEQANDEMPGADAAGGDGRPHADEGEGGSSSADVPSHGGGGRPDDIELTGMRCGYQRATLDDDDVSDDPLEQFEAWLRDAIAADVPEPNAMVLATTDADGTPSARTVLLKGLDERGFAFYTNLAANPRAALVFPWHAMQRQVRVSGTATPVSRAESAAYFASRPRESQLGAWASRQSSVVADRQTLDQSYAEMEARWPSGVEIPLPDFWGGYRVAADVIEFWQGRTGRLHDRFRYHRDASSGRWIRERLAP